MIGRTNVGGGGTGTAFAYIGVTYPAGATLTCSDGRKTFRAKDTTGLYVFGVPYAATWTVTATYDELVTSDTVAITTLWQDVLLELSFAWDGVAFDSGDQKTFKTGGWQYNSNITRSGYSATNVANIGEYVTFGSIGTDRCCYIQTVNPIQMNGLQSITIRCQTNTAVTSGGDPAKLYLMTRTYGDAYNYSRDYALTSNDGTGTITTNVSITTDDPLYITIGVCSGQKLKFDYLKLNFE